MKSLLGSGLAVKGELSGREDVCIEGEFEGRIRVAGAGVAIGARGRVMADVEADEILIEGRLEGNLLAQKRIAICRTGRVDGDISTPRLMIEEGAEFRGRVEMARPGDIRALQTASVERPERSSLHRVAIEAPEPVR